jgi:hypothetical protein
MSYSNTLFLIVWLFAGSCPLHLQLVAMETLELHFSLQFSGNEYARAPF